MTLFVQQQIAWLESTASRRSACHARSPRYKPARCCRVVVVPPRLPRSCTKVGRDIHTDVYPAAAAAVQICEHRYRISRRVRFGSAAKRGVHQKADLKGERKDSGLTGTRAPFASASGVSPTASATGEWHSEFADGKMESRGAERTSVGASPKKWRKPNGFLDWFLQATFIARTTFGTPDQTRWNTSRLADPFSVARC
jgi:hypothetical protein